MLFGVGAQVNDIPVMWATELQSAYPKRSGPSGWGSMKLLLEVRRALRESTWEQLIRGCENYKAYCQASGKEGTDFVQNPLRFIADGCYLEEFTFEAPKTKEEAAKSEHQRKEAERWAIAKRAGGELQPPLVPDPIESISNFETRIRMSHVNAGRPGNSPAGRIRTADQGVDPRLADRVSSLTARLKA
jgi:hypothetical protein